MRNDYCFDSIWDLKRNAASSLDFYQSQPSKESFLLPRYFGEQKTPQYNDISEAKLMYKRYYFNVVDTIIASIKQPRSLTSQKVAH